MPPLKDIAVGGILMCERERKCEHHSFLGFSFCVILEHPNEAGKESFNSQISGWGRDLFLLLPCSGEYTTHCLWLPLPKLCSISRLGCAHSGHVAYFC